MFKLDFVIIGGQKCGSTYLHSIIEKHPEVNMPQGESPHFENPDYEQEGLAKLETLLNTLDQNKLIGIKRPNYLCKPEVPQRIVKANKDAKLIVILRNPVERFKSAYFHQLNGGFTPILSLNNGVKKLLKGKLKKKYPRTEELIEFGFYAKYLKGWMDMYGDKLLILFYDDLRKDKLEVLRKCYEFLGIASDFMPNEQSLNSRPQKVNYSILRAKLLTKKNKHLFTYNHNKTRYYPKKQSIWNKVVCKSIDLTDRLIVSKFFVNDEKPDFDPKVLQQLLNVYKDDIAALEQLCQVDLSHWLEVKK